MVFDHVEIPKSRVFCDANPEVFNTVMQRGWTGNIMQQTVIRALTEARVRLRTRVAHRGRDGPAEARRDEPDARRTLVLRGADPKCAQGRRGRRFRLRRRHVDLRRTPVRRAPPDPAGLDGAGQRHPQDRRLAQPAGDAGARGLRRPRPRRTAGPLPAGCGTTPRRRNARAFSARRGTWWARRSVAAWNCTSASTLRRPRGTTRSRTSWPQRLGTWSAVPEFWEATDAIMARYRRGDRPEREATS